MTPAGYSSNYHDVVIRWLVYAVVICGPAIYSVLDMHRHSNTALVVLHSITLHAELLYIHTC